MRLSRKISILLVLLSNAPAFAQESDNDYIAELDRLYAAVEQVRENPQSIQELTSRLPSQWIVRTENQIFQIDSRWLKSSLTKLSREHPNETRQLILARITSMKVDMQEFKKAPRSASASRDVLLGILSRREFRNVHGPNLWNLLREKLANLILGILQRIFGTSSFPAMREILVWMLVVVALSALAFWNFENLRRNARREAVSLQQPAVSVKTWSAWMAEAHAMAATDAWREAVHLAYWAALSFLETQGLWHPDSARTPREYLSLLPASSECRSPFTAITYQFEAIWYGHAAAGPECFDEIKKHLESLGCPSN